MKIALIDPARAYAADAPARGPLGGTQSAACYLGQALAKLGHAATLYNHIAAPATVMGVAARPWQALFEGDDAAAQDAFVFVGRWTGPMVAALAAHGKPVYGWMHEAAFNADTIPPHPAFAGLVFVSDWQRRMNAAGMPAGATATVIPNGISPFAAALAARPIMKHPHRAIFAGDAARGLIPLLEIWPQLAAQHPLLELEIYSGTEISRDAGTNAAFRAAVQALPQVVHIGRVAQDELALAMARAAWHLSPNPYPETSCITLLEALALGCRSVITARAALPESAAGFATLVPVDDADNVANTNLPVDADAYIAAFEAAYTQPHDAAAQRGHILARHSWDSAAAAWTGMLASA